MFVLEHDFGMFLACFGEALEEVWGSSGGALEEVWRRSGGALEEV